MFKEYGVELHIPRSIRFECTRCANCCLSWPVPLTEKDVKQMSQALHLDETALPISFLSKTERQPGLIGFTRALDKRPDGRCSYLTDEGCSLHNLAKPAMCQLFPYTFIDTPDGTFVGLSFASSGVLSNSGRLLNEQNDQLQETLTLFRALFPGLAEETVAAYKQLQLSEGISLSYEQYREFEAPLLSSLEEAITNASGNPLPILLSIAQRIFAVLPDSVKRSRLPGSEARPRQIDQYILEALAIAFFNKEGRLVDDQLIAGTVANRLTSAASNVKVPIDNSSFSMVQFLECKLGKHDSDNLLMRFAYVRVFSKMYFGPGFSQLSFLAGLSHLIMLIVLVRLSLKARKILGKEADLSWAIEEVRLLDSKLTSVRYGANTRAMIEILSLDPERLERLISLAN